ncbi:hypothetical protein [Tahibacter sp.]|uniref:hypothetical protein n=1 Tax=Tahibacter sp. TaxID=2056211 RepID=UPI0028C3E337|nr:hypothetical protein [Tahibacter sp.]
MQSGTFVAADAVEEPDVFAVLPKAWLSNGVLKGVRSLPFDDAIATMRDSPQAMSGTQHWPGHSEADRALKDNFYSIVNEDDARVTVANQCPYKSGFDPWLYDRSSTMYTLYFRSGTLKTLREAVRASDYYADRINAQGYFTLRAGDTKYAYAENLAYTAWLTGDTSLAAKVTAVVSAQDSFGHVWQNDPTNVERMLAPYWVPRLGKPELRAYQASARGGELVCRLAGSRVELDGACVFYLEGEIEF